MGSHNGKQQTVLTNRQESKDVLTKEHANPYKISAKKVGKRPKDIEQWRKEKKETEQRKKASQPTEPKDKAQPKEQRYA
jgi:hypothetical protein